MFNAIPNDRLRQQGATVSEDSFVDYYELLQVSSKADTDTISRIYRHLAKKFHPDNKESGDIDRFRQLTEAYGVLSNPEKRAGYDVRYQEYWNGTWKLTSEATSRAGFSDDSSTREKLLAVLYVQRRRDMRQPGLGNLEIAHLLDVPMELIDFHVWYLKAKGWIELLETGRLAISAHGVDQVEQNRRRRKTDNMLMPGGDTPNDSDGQPIVPGTGDRSRFPGSS